MVDTNNDSSEPPTNIPDTDRETVEVHQDTSPISGNEFSYETCHPGEEHLGNHTD